MARSIEQVINGDLLPHSPDSSHQPVILWNNTDNKAGIYVPRNGVILAEESNYEPMPYRSWRFQEENAEAPFMTSGNQVLVDLRSFTYATREIYYEEGEVQGLVYAVDAIQYGGRLEPEDYWAHIHEWVEEFQEPGHRWAALGRQAVEKYIKLGFIEQGASVH